MRNETGKKEVKTFLLKRGFHCEAGVMVVGADCSYQGDDAD